MYDYIFQTIDSSFYKVNLYNELIKRGLKIYVIFLCKKNKYRTEEFLNYPKKFEYEYLNEGIYEERSQISNTIKILQILNKKKYKRLVIGGWDSLENWAALIYSKKKKNAIVVESSEFESKTTGIKGLLKKLFLSKISLAFVSGESQKKLLEKLKYRGEIRKTKGVGLYEINNLNENKKNCIKNKIKKFIYVGGLIPVKNVEQLIEVFNSFPELELTIVGTGFLEKNLKEKANKNINFMGHVENKKLNKIYQQHDIFILPSKSEPWGLVVEEALLNGLPVILSNKVGCATEIIKEGIEGFIYDVNNINELKVKIQKIIEINNYKMMKKNVESIDFYKIKETQIQSYINLIEKEKI